VTQVVPFEAFYPAEDYHQEYFRRNPGAGYCRVVIEPKVAKFRQKYLAQLKSA
jgi:peptide-methionine (S)-S-oxide reductase